MFYSHEILTSRKYGVATVWLVATLGSKSGTKKVTRKAILEVNVGKACDTIVAPEAPMALRLQSNLLYGVSRVYDQQCGYVLSDAQATQNQIRALLKVVKSNDIDASGVQARPEQIMLMDDPAFNPDHALPALDFDFGNLELEPTGDSQRSTQSMLSVRERSGSVVSVHSAPGINLPSSSHGGGFANLIDPLGNSSVRKQLGGTGRELVDDEPLLYEDALNFEFGEDGEMRDVDLQERGARLVDPFGSDIGASGRVRKEHEDAVAGRALPEFDVGGDYDMMDYRGDDLPVLPDDAEPFSVASASHAGSGRPRPALFDEEQFSEEAPSFESAEATQMRRKRKAWKFLAADRMTELHNSDLIAWQKGYLDNMKADKGKKVDKMTNTQAKKNAVFFVIGSGLNGVGAGVGSSKLPSPLEIFSGPALLAAITGIPIEPAAPKNNGKKRASPVDGDIEADGQSSPKRSRHDEPEDEIGRAFDDDMGMLHMDDTSQPEMGRDAASALLDHASSAIFPWNVSQSVNSHARATSSMGGRLPSHRLPSASPLLGRGAPMGDLDFNVDTEDQVMYGRDDPFMNDDAAIADVSESQFEMFGAAAQVDTQTAGNAQWVHEALDRESGNFFSFIQNTIAEKGVDELSQDGEDYYGDGDGKEAKCVAFEELFGAENSKLVAAQAFYHILALATKGRVWVEQDVDERYTPYGELRIGVVA